MAQDVAADAATIRQLQRVDQSICGVLAKSRHAALYTFRIDATGKEVWDKDKLEGMFYLTRRQNEPRFALCVLNKMGGGDLCQQLKFCTSDFEYEFNRNFFIFRVNSLIRAVWLMEDDVETVKSAIEAAERETMNSPPVPKYVVPNKNQAMDDLLSLEELRESLFRLIASDKFMHNLHAQYVASEQRKRASSSSSNQPSPMQQPVMGMQQPPPIMPQGQYPRPVSGQAPHQYMMFPPVQGGHPNANLASMFGPGGVPPGMPPGNMFMAPMGQVNNISHQPQPYQKQQ